MKYKYLLMLLLLCGLSVMSLSSGNEKKIPVYKECNKCCCKCIKHEKPKEAESHLLRYSTVNHLLFFI